ncbi:hypothetical protein [uncultured Roseobacter sp.]|uniref:hypothetical protein n=1 Tax=uncultured Roseobacter sp. TaxID=114847 RepID=UPI00262AAF12|nr:hypothetical protein [uncultured Roseobacter sp.]
MTDLGPSVARRFCVGITSVLRRCVAGAFVTLYLFLVMMPAHAGASYRAYDTVLGSIWGVCQSVIEEGALNTDGLDQLSEDQTAVLKEAMNRTPRYVEDFAAAEAFYAFWAGSHPMAVVVGSSGTVCHVIHLSSGNVADFTDQLLTDWKSLTRPDTANYRPSRLPEPRTVYDPPFGSEFEGVLIAPLPSDFVEITITYRYGKEVIFLHAKAVRQPASDKLCSLWPEECGS